MPPRDLPDHVAEVSRAAWAGDARRRAGGENICHFFENFICWPDTTEGAAMAPPALPGSPDF